MRIEAFGILLACLFPHSGLAGELEDQFLEAVHKSDVEAVKELIAKGVNVNTKFRYDRVALSFACDRGNQKVVQALLDSGADVNARDSLHKRCS